MHNMIDQAAIEAALSMGMLNPDFGSLTNPDPSSIITGRRLLGSCAHIADTA